MRRFVLLSGTKDCYVRNSCDDSFGVNLKIAGKRVTVYFRDEERRFFLRRDELPSTKIIHSFILCSLPKIRKTARFYDCVELRFNIRKKPT